jgi:hypothetical protein
MEMVIDTEHDRCSVRICVYMWMLVMCRLFFYMGLYARDMDIFHVHTTHMWEVIGYCAVHVLMYAILGCGLADHFFPWSVGKLGFLFQRSVRRHCFWNATWLLCDARLSGVHSQASGHWVGNGLGSVLVSVYMYIVLYVCALLWKGRLCVFFLWHFIAVLSPSLGLAICKSGILHWVYTWC